MFFAIKKATRGITWSLRISAQRQAWKLPALPRSLDSTGPKFAVHPGQTTKLEIPILRTVSVHGTVVAKDTGMLTIGSTMTKRELNAKPSYSASVRGVIGVGPGRAARHAGPGARWP